MMYRRRFPCRTAALAAALCLFSGALPDVRAGANLGWHNRVKKTATMDITAATFFGTKSPEEFLGVVETPEGDVVAVGNSWGPPLPRGIPDEQVLGTDGRWDVPLYPLDQDRDEKGNLAPPPEENPNRTGIMVCYSPDLKKIRKLVRFGWGIASITAAEYMSDGSVVVAGTATRNFRSVAKNAGLLKIYPKRRYSGYGPIEYEKNTQPGDCYVAKLDAGLRKFQWIWIFEGHRVPPAKIWEGPKGSVVFECRTLKSITKDGLKMWEVMKIMSTGRRMVLGVHPLDGRIMIGGDYHHSTGREPWRKPVLDLYDAGGKPWARFYDWHGPLVGHNGLRLVSDSAVRKGNFMPNGDIILYIWSDGGNSVATCNPVDIRGHIPRSGLRMSMAGATVGSFCHLVRFNPDDYRDCSYTLWAAYLTFKPNSIFVGTIAGASDGRILLSGRAAGFLVQTTTRWFRAGDHYNVWRTAEGKTGGIKYKKNGWPDFIGVGGRGEFSTVFSPGFTNVLWSSCLAKCGHKQMRETTRGVAAVSVCTGAKRDDGRKLFFEDHDVAHWREFLTTIAAQAKADEMSPGKRLWDYLGDEIKKELAALKPKSIREIPDELKEKVFEEFNRLLVEGEDFWDGESWGDMEFSYYEELLLKKVDDAEIEEDDLIFINRRLLEKAYPKYVFECPKDNRPPVVDSVQPWFGGGYSDGHIYLLEKYR